MKLCFFADGTSPHTYNAIKHFAGGKHDITLFSMRPIKKEVKDLNIKIIENKFCPRNGIIWMSYYIIAHLIFLRQIRKIKCDLIHVHDIYRYGPFAYLSKKKYILTPWGTDILIIPKKNIIFKKILPLILNKSKFIMYDGANIYDALRKFKVPKTKLKYFPFGVDTEKFKPSNKTGSLRKKFSGKDLIVSTRNLEPVYDIKTLLFAIKIITKSHKDVEFIIIGEGSEKNELINLSKDLKIRHYITFEGRVTQKTIANYLATADIYVSTSLSDGGIAISTVEAMASGIPVVISNFGENSKWVNPNKNGYIFECKDSHDLAKKILTLLQDKEKMKKFGKNNREKIVKEYSHIASKKIIRSLYAEAIKND